MSHKAGAKFAHTSGPPRDHPKTSKTKILSKNAQKVLLFD